MFWLYQSYRSNRNVGRMSVFGLRWCGVGGVGGEWVRGLGQGMELWGGVMTVLVASMDYLCRWRVQVPVYCARRRPAPFRCTQCSILLHLMVICFLQCICLWHILQIQNCMCVVFGPGFVLTSPAIMRCPYSRLAQKNTIN